MIFNTATAVTSTGDQFYQLINADGGTIGGSATLDVTTKNLSSGRSLFVAILNSTNDGGATGTVVGNAVLNMNVSGTSTVVTDATFQINGSDSAASSAINFNGGTYKVVGTFEGFMDGSGTMTFNNASVGAEVIKAGVFGNNGTLTIGGGAISANTLLKLYAPGSNGMLNFVGNVTLSSGTAANLAASTITIQPSFVVTIAGNGGAANVYTANPNYAGFGGNNPANGTFGGKGANRPQPLRNAPSFTDPPASRAGRRAQTLSITNITSAGRVNGGLGGRGPAIRVSDSSQLAALLENASPGRDGKVRIASSAVPRTASAGIAPTQTSRVANVRDRHRSVDMNVGSKMVASRLP
jgi:hypothetical protein